MISEKTNNDLVNQMLNRSLTFDNVNTKSINDISRSTSYLEEIIQVIYPEYSKVLPIEKASDIFVWVNDEQQLSGLRQRVIQWKKDKKNIHIIFSGRNSLSLNGVNEYQINNKSVGILALGYFDYVLNVRAYTPSYIKEADRTFDAFKQMTREYSIAYVSKETGLSATKIKSLYEEIRSSKQNYQWLALNISDDVEFDIQTARAICLMPALNRNVGECDFIPISIERWSFEKSFSILIHENHHTLMPNQENLLPFSAVRSSISSRDIKNRSMVSFYDWEFADYFDVDPLPSFR